MKYAKAQANTKSRMTSPISLDRISTAAVASWKAVAPSRTPIALSMTVTPCGHAAWRADHTERVDVPGADYPAEK